MAIFLHRSQRVDAVSSVPAASCSGATFRRKNTEQLAKRIMTGARAA